MGRVVDRGLAVTSQEAEQRAGELRLTAVLESG